MTYINRKYIETTIPKDIDYDDHVDGIDDPRINDVLLDRNNEENYWSNGFQLEVEGGTWYEIYLSERANGDGLKSYKDLDNKESEMINALQNLYKGSNFEHFKDYGQITFYVSQKEEILTWDRLLSSVEAIYKNNSLNQATEVDYKHNLKFLTELFQTLDKAIKNQSKESIIDKEMIIEQIKKGELDYWDIDEEVLQPVYLDLINYRELSNKIAADLDVMHQSPQVLIVKNGKCTYQASHNQIDVAAIKQNL